MAKIGQVISYKIRLHNKCSKYIVRKQLNYNDEYIQNKGK